MAAIRVTPETLDAQGDALVGYSEQIGTILGQISSKITEIIDGWDGLAQDAYYNMYQEMEKTLKEFPVAVDSLGQATKSAAATFSQVDDELKTKFSSL